MEKLPSDVLWNILIRLPAKPLAQMRCVSKPWNSLLSQPSFIKSHLHRSIHNNDGIILVGFNPAEFIHDPFTTFPCRSPHPELPRSFKLPVAYPREECHGSVIGSVNGLVCFSFTYYLGRDIHIWNPSLSAVLTLPPYTIPFSVLLGLQASIHFRFGYDPKTDDYKVVKLISQYPPPGIHYKHGEFGTYVNAADGALQVAIYSTRKGSWEQITQRFPSNITLMFNTDEVCVDGQDGHLHWLGYIGAERKLQTIIGFDLGFETFSEISLPDCFVGFNVHQRIVLGALAGKLCVMSCIRKGECEVWVMDEYGVAESWVKHYVLSPINDYLLPLGFSLNNEFLFEEVYESDYCLALYDPVSAKFKSVDIMMAGDKSIWYVDSLVWVAPPKTGSLLRNQRSESKKGETQKRKAKTGKNKKTVYVGLQLHKRCFYNRRLGLG